MHENKFDLNQSFSMEMLSYEYEPSQTQEHVKQVSIDKIHYLRLKTALYYITDMD